MADIVQTRGLCKQYGKVLRVNRLDLRVPEGAIYGFLGPNGAGKSTTLKMILGLVHPTAGSISVFGKEVNGHNRLDMLKQVGSLIESPSYYGHLTGEENLKVVQTLRGVPEKDVYEVLEIVRLEGQRNKKAAHYSLGMKQRLGLALALMNHPEFLLLDEPINGLDPEGIVEFRELLLQLNRERQTTILISSHILSELSTLATHYAFIEKGRVLESVSADRLREKCRECLELTVDDAARAARVLEEQLGTRDFEVLPHNKLRLYTFLDQPQTVNRVLLENGVGLISAQQRSSNLEDYFLSLIGGRHAAGKEGF